MVYSFKQVMNMKIRRQRTYVVIKISLVHIIKIIVQGANTAYT
jgi:hypothetical protein